MLAVEITGFGDPSKADLVALSMSGAASVVRSNILAHYRFGCARAGELLFDADEYIFVEDLDAVPAELQDMFRLVCDDLADEPNHVEHRDPFAVGLAMCEVVTGLEVSADHVQGGRRGFFAAPSDDALPRRTRRRWPPKPPPGGRHSASQWQPGGAFAVPLARRDRWRVRRLPHLPPPSGRPTPSASPSIRAAGT